MREVDVSLELSVNSMSETLTLISKCVILKISEKLTWRRSMDKTIGIRLKEARNNVGMYQEDAARSMEMSRPTLSAIEAGKRAVTAEEIKDFAGLYHVTTNWLLFGADQEEENRMQKLGAYYQLFMKLSGQEQKEVIQFMKQILSK
ncbi:MAG: XRE family transcriptional regulator [Holdemanella biformis]|nr:XRE family transcriptional regulator [Holdemanella biformis]